MKLSVVVTHYNEPLEVVKPLFQSIEIQKGIEKDDFEVIVVNDGGKSLFLDYPFVREINISHGGVSMARNVGLDEAKGEYVMFCDCDDMFLNNYALHTYIDTFKEYPEVVVSQFIEEQKVDGVWRIFSHPTTDPTFIHGKIFQKAFLEKWGIRFNQLLSIHEDGFFVALALNLAHGIRKIEVPLYLWVENPNSVVRKNHKDYFDRTYIDLLMSRKCVADELKLRNFNNIPGYICGVFTDAYYDTQRLKKEYLPAVYKYLKAVYNGYKDELGKVMPAMLHLCLEKSRNNACQHGIVIEEETFGQWLRRVVNK